MSAPPALGAIAATGQPAGEAVGSVHAVRRLLARPSALACIAYLVLLVGVAIVAPLVLPSVAHQQAGDLYAIQRGPSWQHLLGTDSVGRDVLDRLLVGSRSAVVGIAEAFVVTLALGVPWGLFAGYIGGRLDQVSNWVANLAFAMPALIIALVVLTVFPSSMLAAMVTIGALSAPFLMRVVRSATLLIREEPYIAAAQVSGLSRAYIVRRHVLPRIAGPIIIQGALVAGGALLAQAGFAYLGLLGQPPAPTWGGMLNDGLNSIALDPWLVWPPGVVITLTVLALGMLGDAIRDVTAETWTAPVRRKRRRRAAAGRAGQSVTPKPGPATEGRPTLLTVDGLGVGFPSPSKAMVSVVEDVTFDIGVGETVGLVGESGSGKTVTAMSILGLVPGTGQITGGRITFNGRDITALPERDLRRLRGSEIGLVSQEPMVSFNPVFRIGWQLADLFRIHHGLSRRAARQSAIKLLERVRLPDPEAVARRYPHELSGGMAQRAAIARALIGDPKLLIADEPTTALDVTVQAEILDLLRDLQRDRGMAVLLVTHDWGVVADLCDRAVVMYAGQIIERGNVRQIFRSSLHPYTRALLASNPHAADGQSVLPTIRGTVPKPGEWPQGCHFHPRCDYATKACSEHPVGLEHTAEGSETRCIHFDQLLSAR
jgi:peptide/nickel transport system permease protein